ncbi:RNA/RNP complex-1-interacting phosphatase-like [Ciona intestinalis]
MSDLRPVPEDWFWYTSMGERVGGTRLVAMKVPINENMTRPVKADERFTCSDVVTEAKRRNMEIGFVIDLSSSSYKYYHPDSFVEKGIKYQKLHVKGQTIPKTDVVASFINLVKTFISENLENDLVIAVHCLHGLNRSGYLICQYLIQENGLEPQRAIEIFNSARGHNMEREKYLESLLG